MLEISNECFECSPSTLQFGALTFLWRVGENSRNKHYCLGKTSAIFWVPVNLIDSWLFWPWKKTWISKTDPVLCTTYGSSVNTMRRMGLENFHPSSSTPLFFPSLPCFSSSAYSIKPQTINVSMLHQTIWASMTHSLLLPITFISWVSCWGWPCSQAGLLSLQCWDTAEHGQSAGHHQLCQTHGQINPKGSTHILPHSSTAQLCLFF